MCGIIGFNWEDKSLLKRMADVIIHRGPDDAAYFTDSGISLGMRRLSIIDLKKDLYPISNENEDIFLVFNGEIYNFKKIREMLEEKGHKFKTDCDAESIIHCYEEYGENFLNYLNGMFAICIYDTKKKTLLLARDRIGIKPLYYYENMGNLIFASEIKSILEVNSVKRSINKEVVNNYFTLGYYNPGENTFFKDIKKLLPGHYLKFDLKNKSFNIQKYWDINLNLQDNKGESYFKNKLFDLLKDSVKKRLISDVPLGVFLSGGIDSSTIVYFMDLIRKEEEKEGSNNIINSNSKIKSYSVGFKDGEKTNETVYAKQVSQLFGTDHEDFIIEPDMVKILPKIVWHTDEPISDPALIPVFLLSEKAKKTSTVILTGDGGDELFGGYDHHWILNAVNKTSKIPFSKSIGPFINHRIPLKTYDKVFKYSSDIGRQAYNRGDKVLKSIKQDKTKAYYHLKSIFDEDERKELLKPEWFQEVNLRPLNNNFFDNKHNKGNQNKNDFLKQLLYFDTKQLLAEGFLMKTDKMTMAQSIEARVPFLDHRVVELAFRMPSKYKIKGLNNTKYILRKLMAPHLPKNIIQRKKQGFFMPIEQWLNNDLKSFASDLLNTTKIHHEGILSPEYIKKIKENYEQGKLYYARQMWNLITFELWYRKYILKEKIR